MKKKFSNKILKIIEILSKLSLIEFKEFSDCFSDTFMSSEDFKELANKKKVDVITDSNNFSNVKKEIEKKTSFNVYLKFVALSSRISAIKIIKKICAFNSLIPAKVIVDKLEKENKPQLLKSNLSKLEVDEIKLEFSSSKLDGIEIEIK